MGIHVRRTSNDMSTLKLSKQLDIVICKHRPVYIASMFTIVSHLTLHYREQEAAMAGVDHGSYGVGGVRPRWMQGLNKPAFFLVFTATAVFIQSMCVNGLIGVSISTLERRFVHLCARMRTLERVRVCSLCQMTCRASASQLLNEAYNHGGSHFIDKIQLQLHHVWLSQNKV